MAKPAYWKKDFSVHLYQGRGVYEFEKKRLKLEDAKGQRQQTIDDYQNLVKKLKLEADDKKYSNLRYSYMLADKFAG